MLGATIIVPAELYNCYPFNASAYAFLQQLRQEIFEFGIVEFPHLPLNKTNHTLAQRSPKEHTYSSNNYLTDLCQYPHQDTPPYPTAFWLAKARQFFSTWVLDKKGVEDFITLCQHHPHISLLEAHEKMVPLTLKNHTGIILNQSPGLLLIDNSEHQALYHARTCNFQAIRKKPNYSKDTAMYAYNEIGLLNYIDTLDSRRGKDNRCTLDLDQVKRFMSTEKNHLD